MCLYFIVVAAEATEVINKCLSIANDAFEGEYWFYFKL
jgi:hypothetical protein